MKMNYPSKREVWTLAERLMSSIFEAICRIDELAPEFPDELYEARDQKMEGLQVGDYIERLADHSQIHRHELASVRAAVGRSRPTDPGDTNPNTGEAYARTWYQWRLLEAFLRRAEMVSELIGLNDEDLDIKPSPELVAGNERSIREVCEHVLSVQKWIMFGVEDGISAYRKTKGDVGYFDE
jgi:hypothetical protein